MQTRSQSTTSEKIEGGDAQPHLAGNASKPVKEICHVMISELQEEVRAELKLVREDVSKLRTNTEDPGPHSSLHGQYQKHHAIRCCNGRGSTASNGRHCSHGRAQRPINRDGSLFLQSC